MDCTIADDSNGGFLSNCNVKVSLNTTISAVFAVISVTTNKQKRYICTNRGRESKYVCFCCV